MSASKNRLFAVVLATAILNVGSCFAFSDAAEVRNANEHYTDEEERLLASGHIIFPKKAYFSRAKRAVTVDPIAVHERNSAGKARLTQGGPQPADEASRCARGSCADQ